MDKAKLKIFKKNVLKSMNLSSETELRMFSEIPDAVHESIFVNNFNSNQQLAKNIMLNKFDQDSYKKIEKEKLRINDMTKASTHLIKAIDKKTPVLFLTDTDNDGSLAQAGILEFNKALTNSEKSNINILYCQAFNGNTARGFTVDIVDEWMKRNPEFKDSPITIISADNGINSREEQEKINEKYPNSMLIVTDHHLPDEEEVVVENKRTMIVNPKYKPSEYFKVKNISGANVLTVLLEKTLKGLEEKNTLEEDVAMNAANNIFDDLTEDGVDRPLYNRKNVILNMREIGRIANLLDYVSTDISDKPLKDHLVEKYSTIGGLMNVNNSMNKIITSEYSDDEIRSFYDDIEGLDIDVLIDCVQKIQEQNNLAEKILTLQFRYNSMSLKERSSLSSDGINQHMIVELNKRKLDSVSDSINPNFIEQIRPYVFNYVASTGLTDYEVGILDVMKNIYLNIKKQERILQNEFGKADIMNIEKLDNATIMYPKKEKYLRLLNRKLLGKIKNEENNGFLMILDNVERTKATGSFRSLYKIQDILKGKKTIENMFDVKISFQGHDVAAGFFIESNNGNDLNKNVISDINVFLNKNLETLKLEDKTSYAHLIQTDFNAAAIAVFNKYNQAIKGSLTNMQSLSPVIQFNKSTYLTNSTTQKEQSLQEIVREKKYGYVPVELSFDGKTVIMPTELLRKISDSNFKDGLQVSFMADGVFIGNRLIPNVNKQKLIKIKANNDERDSIVEFWNNNYKEHNCFVELPKEHIEKAPFFKFNKYGESEFKRYESTVINIIERSGVDMLVVADTEANGLGNAPKVSNLGVVELSIDENTGSKLDVDDFNNSAFKTMNGSKYVLNKRQIMGLTEISSSAYDALSFDDKQNVIINIENPNKHYISESLQGYKRLHNSKIIKNGVVFNREIKASIGSIFIKDHDVKISERIKTLTKIDNTLLNKIGMTSENADKLLAERYKDSRCIFQAHNLPYDLGVIKGNFKEFYNIVTDFKSGNLLNDSAIYSREDQLAYDPIGIAVFEKGLVPALSGVQFFDSKQSSLSLDKFLSSEDDGTLPDRQGRYVLKKKNGNVSLIDQKEHSEVSVNVSIAAYENNSADFAEEGVVLNPDKETNISMLKKLIRHVSMPKDKLKYSVQALSNYDVLRSVVLNSEDFKVKAVDIPESFIESKSTLQYFMMNYHFDSSASDNFLNFKKTLTQENLKDMFLTEGFAKEEYQKIKDEWDKEQEENPPKRKRKEPNHWDKVPEDPKLVAFKEFSNKFLEENSDLQAKFHDIWAYSRVLAMVNPVKASLKDDDLIDLINYKTSISQEKIIEIMKDGLNFKEMFNVNEIIQIEPHNNVFFDKCDAVMESVLTIKRPTDRNYNSFTHDSDSVVEMYMKNILKSTSMHMVSQQRYMAADSFSKKQADSYKRRTLTDYIASNQELDLENVKFKFSAGVLPTDTFVYATLKHELSNDKIAEFSKDLEYVVQYEQIKNSIEEKSYKEDHEKELLSSLRHIMSKNKERVNEIKDRMAEHFETVSFSRKENDMKKCLQQSVDAIFTDVQMTHNKNMEPLRKEEKNIVVALSVEFEKIANKLGVSKLEKMKENDINVILGRALSVSGSKEDEIKVENQVIQEDDNNSEMDKLVKGDSPHKIEHTLLTFLANIPEISEEEYESLHEKKNFTIKEKYENSDEAMQMLDRANILDSVPIKRRDDAVQLFKFNKLLNGYLSDLRTGNVDFDLDMSEPSIEDERIIAKLEQSERIKAERALEKAEKARIKEEEKARAKEEKAKEKAAKAKEKEEKAAKAKAEKAAKKLKP